MSDRFIPQSIIGGESIWISAANTVQNSTDIAYDSITPAEGYTLAFLFSADSPLTVAAVANADNTGWTLDVTGAQTLTFSPGDLSYAAIATKSGRSIYVESGIIIVKPSPVRVSAWKQVLADIDNAIAQYSKSPNGTVSMGDMQVTYKSMADLTKMREYAEHKLRRDTGQGVRRRILTRFA